MTSTIRLALSLTLAFGVRGFATAAPWVTAHYTYWEEAQLSPAEIDLSGITHLIYFMADPNLDGTLDTKNLDKADVLAALVHRARKKILVALGGDGYGKQFSSAILPEHRTIFVTAVAEWVREHHFDGVDIDMEPISATDGENFQAFVRQLAAELKSSNRWAVVAGDFGGQGGPTAIVAPIQDQFDQINLMTYGLSGAYEGWETWHHAPLVTDGHKFKSTGGAMPSCELAVANWTHAGFRPSKLGLGIGCWGYKWTPSTGPNQSIAGVTMSSLTYRDIIVRYFKPDLYHYDSGAKAA